ncbi:MAG TPA: hypothetical protein VM182_02480 [Terriglobia bacterium]|nr:hypothetical protein [Terriglobia bacterium]
MKKGVLCLAAVWVAVALGEITTATLPQASASPAPQAVRPIGVVTQLQPGSLNLRTDAGPEMLVHLPDEVSVLRVPPGAKDLKTATPIEVSDINPGDRVLVRGRVADDQKSMLATSVIVMAETDLAKKREAERLEWRQRGIGGLVTELNPETKEITVSVPNTPPTPGNLTHPAVVTLAANAQLLRYAPGSVKFRDAKPGSFKDIKVGDQVRALGAKSEDGSRLTAEKLVSGTFRNIGATVVSVDAPNGTVTVKDLASGQPVLVRTNPDSRLRRLPPFLAQMIAGVGSGGPPPTGPPGQAPTGGAGGWRRGGPSAGGPRAGAQAAGSGERSGNGPPDFQRMLERAPALTLGELQPGEALMVVGTEGATPSDVTAITILAGVEPILTAKSKDADQMVLGPWSMSEGEGGP